MALDEELARCFKLGDNPRCPRLRDLRVSLSSLTMTIELQDTPEEQKLP